MTAVMEMPRSRPPVDAGAEKCAAGLSFPVIVVPADRVDPDLG